MSIGRVHIELLEPRQLLTQTTIDGVLPVSLDQPQIHAIMRRSLSDSLPIMADDGLGGIAFDMTAYFDSGTSGVLLSLETAQGLGIAPEMVNGMPATYYDVGVAGADAFGISEPLYFSLAPFSDSYDPGSIDVADWADYYTQTGGPIRSQLAQLPADELIGPLDIIGMPMFDGRVVVMDARPLAQLSTMQTYVYAPGTPFYPVSEHTNPGIPIVDHHIKLSYSSFDRFTFVDPPTAERPTTSGNPFIGPDPVKKLDDPNYDDGTPPVGMSWGGNSSTGSFLLDTGSAASFISQAQAAALGVHYAPGTYGSDNPELVDSLGNPLANQFGLVVGGIGGSIPAAGFYLDNLVLHTQEGDDIVFNGAPVLVLDITVEDPETGQTMVLDGDIGMNYFVASADIVDGWPNDIHLGGFDWITLDVPDGTLGLQLASYTQAQLDAPVITAISPDTGVPDDGITSASPITIHGTATPEMLVNIFRDGELINTDLLDFVLSDTDGSWSYTDRGVTEGKHVYTATITDLFSESPLSDPYWAKIDRTAPQVSSIVINDGNAQGSMISSITVTFDERVTLSNPFDLTTRNGAAVQDVTIAVDNTLEEDQIFVITFSGPAITGDSLADGMYKLVVNASGVHDQAGNAQAASSSKAFHRLFGDSDGDRDVDRADLNLFRAAMNRTSKYVWWLDYNDDKTINMTDYLALKSRMTRRVL